jgi:hypothetical protein
MNDQNYMNRTNPFYVCGHCEYTTALEIDRSCRICGNLLDGVLLNVNTEFPNFLVRRDELRQEIEKRQHWLSILTEDMLDAYPPLQEIIDCITNNVAALKSAKDLPEEYNYQTFIRGDEDAHESRS